MLWPVIILTALTGAQHSDAVAAKAAIHVTNLGNLCSLAANLGAAGEHLKNKIESFKSKLDAEEKIRRTALILGGATSAHNLTVRLANAYATIKLLKATQLLTDAGAKAAEAGTAVGKAAGGIREAFSILEQLTKSGSTASAQSACLADGATQGASNKPQSTGGSTLEKCLKLSGASESTAADPFSYKALLATAQAGGNIFTNGAAGSGSNGCPLTNIETDSFGKQNAGLATLNLAAGLIQLSTTGGDHSHSQLIAHSDVQAKAPKVQTAITAYISAIQAVTTTPIEELEKLQEKSWQTAKTDADLLQAFKDVGAVPQTTTELTDASKATYDNYIKAREKWQQPLDGGKELDTEWHRYLAARSTWMVQIELAAEKKPTCPSTATKPEEACNAIGDSEAKKCNETDNCHFVESNEKGKNAHSKRK
uniref:Variant surface glycoprotein n=1 Tax=Trypanosoma brucei TaxID=5691 RepID=A0A1V0FY92_9TRYP|nr:variant surface glycoprotein [Trypanosoma brucei]